MKQHKSIKIETELIKAIERKALNENRSFNNMVEVLLKSSFIQCDHEYAPYNTQNGYISKCHKCGFEPKSINGF